MSSPSTTTNPPTDTTISETTTTETTETSTTDETTTTTTTDETTTTTTTTDSTHDPTTTRPPTSTPTPTGRPTSSTSISSVTNTVSLPGGGYTTIVTSIIVVDGQTSTVVSTPSVTPTGGGSNNIGTIVGASVGGAIAVALIGLMWFILARKARERRHKQFENDIFNPDHGTRGPGFDLGGPDPETIPEPFTYEQPQMQQYQQPGYNGYPAATGVGGYTATGPPHPMSPYGSSGPHYDAMSATSGSATTPGMAGVGVAGALGAAAGAAGAAAYGQNRLSGTPTTGDDGSTGSADRSSVQPLTPSAPPQPLTGRAAKEREAWARSAARVSQNTTSPVLAPGMLSPAHTGNGVGPAGAYNYTMGHAPTVSSDSRYSTDSGAPPGSPVLSAQSHGTTLGIANPDHHHQQHVPRTSTSGTGVVVHQDAGRLPQPAEDDEHDEAEIPPTYDSIPVDHRPRGGAAASAPAGDQPRPLPAAPGERPTSAGEARPVSLTNDQHA